MADLGKLFEAVSEISKLVLKSDNAHMKEPWQMIVGGLVLPEAAKADPSVLEDKGNKALIDQYSREKVEEFFTAKTIEKEVVKEVEKIVEKEVPVEKVVVKKVPVEGAPIESGKYRRLKDKVNKESRKETGLDSAARDVMIQHWNKVQDLVDKKDPVCQKLTEQINGQSGRTIPIFPLQVAGYFSYLCRLGRKIQSRREGLIDYHMKKGNITVRPYFSKELIDKILIHWREEKEDRERRKKDHAELRARRAAEDMTPIKSGSSSSSNHAAAASNSRAPQAPEKKEAAKQKDFDIKFSI